MDVKLLGNDFEVEYRRGKENRAADALFRKEEGGTLTVMSNPIPTWVETIRNEYKNNLALQGLV